MISIREAIYTALKEAVAPVSVSYLYPKQDARFPCVSYYESENAQYAQADGKEYLTEMTYQVDIWGQSVKENDGIAAKIDGAMKAMGFRRDFCHDMEDQACKHKTMRYRVILDQALHAYQ